MRTVIWVVGGTYYTLQPLQYPDVIKMGLEGDSEETTIVRIIFCEADVVQEDAAW